MSDWTESNDWREFKEGPIERVCEICAAIEPEVKAGLTLRDIAEKLGIHRSTAAWHQMQHLGGLERLRAREEVLKSQVLGDASALFDLADVHGQIEDLSQFLAAMLSGTMNPERKEKTQ